MKNLCLYERSVEFTGCKHILFLKTNRIIKSPAVMAVFGSQISRRESSRFYCTEFNRIVL